MWPLTDPGAIPAQSRSTPTHVQPVSSMGIVYLASAEDRGTPIDEGSAEEEPEA